jgi:putative spermidine/putrescine transport system ATP-binding protein
LIGLLGPSGCGKTTTLRMIGGLMPATEGRILVAGRDVTALPPHKRDMGIVFQNYALFPHMDVAGNLGFGLEMRKVSAAERDQRVRRALAMVRLESFAARKPRELSGGQQQRVALARALVIEPSILLLDEPLSNLDANLREEMRNEIRDIQQRLGITAVFVTHDQSEALAICDRIAVMRLGVLEQLGTPFEIYERPANEFVAGFVGRVNRAAGVRAQDGSLRLGDAVVQGSGHAGAGPVTIMIRPHRIRLGGAAAEGEGWNSVTGTVTRRTFVGDLLSIEVQVGPATLLVEQHSFAGAPGPAPGESVRLSWRAEDTLVFPAT